METKTLSSTAQDLYEQDFVEWTLYNAKLLRAGRFDEIDVERIAEEIEAMGRNEGHEVRSRLRVLLIHLLKWQFQPRRRGSSWIGTIDMQRAEIQDRLAAAPSLRRPLAGDLGKVYQQAVRFASRQTGLGKTDFPKDCPFSLEQVLDEEFFPD